jgi:hypothetical protein
MTLGLRCHRAVVLPKERFKSRRRRVLDDPLLLCLTFRVVEMANDAPHASQLGPISWMTTQREEVAMGGRKQRGAGLPVSWMIFLLTTLTAEMSRGVGPNSR